MPSSKCGGFMLRRRKRRNAPSPRMSHGVQSMPFHSPDKNGAGARSVSARAESSPLLGSASMRILVTGGCGFIGSNFIRYILRHYKPTSVTNVDALTYAGNLANLDGVVEE